ncbi:DUF5333 domain-containing protein [Aestuariibius sp. 2305UL40-4]|uniref:DUF5333 domain-containing protein n=1 Tax=Aestuariibius violaceus TaxID=3234132 RepID=UPI00345E5EEA
MRWIWVALVALMAAPVAAKPPLKDVAEVREGIIAVGIAYEISERCDDIDARLFRGISYLNQLKSRARALGYSDAEIDAYTDDEAEKDRLEGIARARLAERGASRDDEAGHCRVGRDEIAANTAVGQLLRAR